MVALRYTNPIDGHVHLRGKEYADRRPSFAELAFRDARAVGLAGLVEEPNPDPYLIDEKSIEDRISEIDKIRGDIEHAIAIAITGEESQILEALDIIGRNPRVPTGKSFFSKTTRSKALEILIPKLQKKSWRNLGDSPKGGIAREGHYEDENMFVLPFNPEIPRTHAYRQLPESEVVQFERQFRYAIDGKFRGTLLVKHTSNPKTIYTGEQLVKIFRPEFRVMFETTFHHMFLNIEDDYPIHGNLVKMNPPLRPKSMQEELLECVLAGRTHIIGTDHAPHPREQKIGTPYKSGIPAIPFYPKAIQLLREHGLKEEDEKRLMFDTGNEIYFQGRLKPRLVTVEYNPQLWKAYGFNTFSRVDGTLKDTA